MLYYTVVINGNTSYLIYFDVKMVPWSKILKPMELSSSNVLIPARSNFQMIAITKRVKRVYMLQPKVKHIYRGIK